MYSQFYFVFYVLLLHAYNVIDAKPPTKIESVDESSAMRLMKKISGDISSRIIGGSTASDFQFPWIAFIELDSKYICGGTLISPRHVLIPASQAHGFSTFKLYFFNGDSRNVIGEIVVFFTKTKIIHPDFNPKTFANNIAIIELPSAVNITEKIQPIRLPAQSQTNKDFAGMEAIVAGWGIVTEDATSANSFLKYANLKIMSNSECSKSFTAGLESSMMCAKGSEGHACLGDNGGPLQIKEDDGQWTLVGTLVGGVRQKCSVYPSVYTRITSFLPWIAKVAGITLRP